MTYMLLLLPGDGIGPELMIETRRVLSWFSANRNLSFSIEEDLVGGAAFDKHGIPATEEMMQKALSADAVLFGAVGGPQWDKLPFLLKPEQGLLRLRKDLRLFANLRPALCFEALKDASTLKPEIVSGLDILIVRELTGGVYFGLPKETTVLSGGQKRAVDTQVYTTIEIERIARVAFELARLRGSRVASAAVGMIVAQGLPYTSCASPAHLLEWWRAVSAGRAPCRCARPGRVGACAWVSSSPSRRRRHPAR